MSLLGIDVGTTGCKAAVFSEDGQCLAQAYREYATLHPQPGWAELDSRMVWKLTQETLVEAVARAGRRDPVRALAVSSLGEAMTPVRHNREIIGNSILSSDARGRDHVARVLAGVATGEFYAINANIPGPNYSLPKLLWLREHDPRLFEEADRFLLWGDLVAFLLGGEPVASHSLASRTLLFDRVKGDWSERLLALSGVPRGKLGRAVPAGTLLGTISARMSRELGLPSDVQLVAGGHDQCCNALGAGIWREGRAVCGMGTYECITPVYGRVPPGEVMLGNGLNIEPHVLEGLSVSFLYNQGGSLRRWFRDTFAAWEHRNLPPGASIYDVLDCELPSDPTRLLVLPYFEMTGPPGFVADASGVILGLKTGTSRGEILKAIMECVTLYFVDSLHVLRELGVACEQFVATGGGAKSDAWLQIKADILGVPFIRPRITEGSVLGAAMVAGLATGSFKTPEETTECFVSKDREFLPDSRRHLIYREKHRFFRDLYPSLAGFMAKCHGDMSAASA